ncbi:diuretic hormone 44 [Vespa velutina]|uniref:diuretic hormone 44 n=1 Tax=Vespa velutina TaxID=202808 RepID=UPI001FB521B5|nr:diuretic hormone 44 [Vespa velutina]XP_047347269.1 diuretic hormone 44 [Vespa velutina]XP_047347270.1 diuretic hormone 44 [Vespa velutina]XP_047347271.1 diuretic hormone 44 [Vespa velutina]
MILITILVTSAMITMTRSAPAVHLPKETGNFPEVLWLVNQRMPELEREMYESSNDPGPTILRTKRIGSLSIVNNFDVLRERILLEIARRKALQDQRQIDANRQILDSIGKRSVPSYEDYTSSSRPRTSERIYDWLSENDSLLGNRHSNQDRRVASNELLWL